MTSTPDDLDAVDEPAGPAEDDAVVAAEPAAVVNAEPAAAATAEPDPALLDARDLALAALREITPEASIGDPAGYRLEDEGVVSLRFENRLAGYPGWFWTVSLARVDDAAPTVLEVELLPGDGALLAPDWVPWAVRLADYQATQAALAESAEGDVDDQDSVDDELDDVDDLDAADFDEDGSRILHAGDVDGVDIDELAEDASDPDEGPDSVDEPEEDDDAAKDGTDIDEDEGSAQD